MVELTLLRPLLLHRGCNRVVVLIAVLVGTGLPVFAAEPSTISVTLASPSAAGVSAYIDAIKVIIWPLSILAIAWFYRRTLGEFVAALAARITKFSVANIEIELSSTAKPASGVTLEQIKEPNAGVLQDSSRMLFQQVQDKSSADYALIDLGKGEEWLTSRLFIGITMLARMRGLRSVVFVEYSAETDHRFVAVANATELRWAIAMRYPWLEAAFAKAYAEAQGNPQNITKQNLFVSSGTGGLEPWAALQIVQNFIQFVQIPPAITPEGEQSEWVTLGPNRIEHAKWITRSRLRRLVGDKAFDAWVYDKRDKPEGTVEAAVLRSSGTYVAVLSGNREFLKLIDRGALLEKSASALTE